MVGVSVPLQTNSALACQYLPNFQVYNAQQHVIMIRKLYIKCQLAWNKYIERDGEIWFDANEV